MKKVLRKSIQTDIESELNAFFYQKDPLVSGRMSKHITEAAKILSKKFIKLATKPEKLVKQGKVYSKLSKSGSKNASGKTSAASTKSAGKKKSSLVKNATTAKSANKKTVARKRSRSKSTSSNTPARKAKGNT